MPQHPASLARFGVLACAFLATGSLGSSQRAEPRGGTPRQAPPRTVEPEGPIRLAILGDFGEAGPDEEAVSALVHSLHPDLVFTVGDNNYPDGLAATIDANIGQYYHDYIAPYLGTFGPGADENRFFPALGNHDWRAPGAGPYLDYFSLPGNERYYDVQRGPVHVFLLDSDPAEPDGIAEDSVQGQWLENELQASVSPFKFVLLHHTPYSSSDNHGPNLVLQWPFARWGAKAVFGGHDHIYERLDLDGIPYCVNGLGGNPTLYALEPEIIAGSRQRFLAAHGAQIVDVDTTRARLRFLTDTGIVFDDYSVFAPDQSAGPEFFAADPDTWRFLDLGTDPGPGWTLAGFDDSGWGLGAGHFGYGDGDEDTLVSFGPDPNAKFLTTHFRRVFSVADPAGITDLRLDLLRDDGAIAYLNGVEVVRTNLPAGPVTIATAALQAVADNPEDSLYEHALDPGLLVAGDNVLAVEIHQNSGTSSDISFAATLQAHRGALCFVSAGSLWNYLDDGVFPGSTWADLGFDDSAWLTGPAELGYGDGDEATVVQFGPDPNDKFIATYFRHEFVVANALDWKALILRLRRDDGAAVYLNGEEVYRNNLPLVGVDATTLAGFGVGTSAGETTLFEARIDHRRLRNGVNVVAVEVHQNAPDSSDLSFDLELVGRR